LLTLRDVHTKNDQVYSSPNPFVVFSDLKQLQEHFPIYKALAEVTPNYNVAPTQEIMTIVRKEGLNLLEKLH
jgi:putative SOS response-associated peptidase YedK